MGKLNFISIALLSVCMGFISCENEMEILSERIPIHISFTPQTRATDDAFEEGDKIGLYVSNYNNGVPSTLMTTGNHVDNAMFVYEDNKWLPENNIYWKDKNTAADFYAYYPYSESPNISAHPFFVQADQSTEDAFWASDFLWGKATNVTPTPSSVAIQTNHSLSSILVDIKPGSGFTAASWAAAEKSVKICEIKTAATINLSTGVATATGNGGEIIPLYAAETGTTISYKAMMIPQVVADNSRLVVVTVDGTEYVYRKGYTFTPNTQHKFTVTVNKSESSVDVTIGEWEIDSTTNEGNAEEENESEANIIPNNQIWYTATAKVEPSASADFGAMIESNEWDSTTGKGIITFDRDVTTIGKAAFSSSKNLTKIIIPNSVTTIGYYVFENCSNLTNVVCEATTPPTLGDYAFNNVSNITITVPESVLESYRSDNNWGQYCILAPADRSAYEVGDLITIDGVQGVVFFANDAVVRVVSVTETNCKWGVNNNYASASNEYYGAVNLATIKSKQGYIDNYPAFVWCEALGDGWYLPAKNELSLISSVKENINTTLTANNLVEISGDYWSSTDNINDGSGAHILNFDERKWNYEFKNTTNLVRAIKVF